jgi:hypothetical protein
MSLERLWICSAEDGETELYEVVVHGAPRDIGERGFGLATRLAEATGVAQVRLAEATGVAQARLAEATGVAQVGFSTCSRANLLFKF